MSTRSPFSGDGWQVVCGRWQDSHPPAVDHVISDPPFDDRTSIGARSGVSRSAAARKANGSAEISRPTITSFMGIDPGDLVPGLLEVARRWVICFCAAEQLGGYQTAAGDRWIRAGAWVKTNPTPQFTGDRPATWGEGIAIMHPKGRKRWNRGGHAGLWSGPTTQAGGHRLRVHETQKPLWLMRALVEAFTDPGDLVWDPYGGSMTTGVACLQLGRRFIGHEVQERYAEVGAERLRAAAQGLTLEAARAGQLPLL